MKNRKYICDNCKCETSKARPIEGLILCATCQFILTKEHPIILKPKLSWFK